MIRFNLLSFNLFWPRVSNKMKFKKKFSRNGFDLNKSLIFGRELKGCFVRCREANKEPVKSKKAILITDVMFKRFLSSKKETCKPQNENFSPSKGTEGRNNFLKVRISQQNDYFDP